MADRGSMQQPPTAKPKGWDAALKRAKAEKGAKSKLGAMWRLRVAWKAYKRRGQSGDKPDPSDFGFPDCGELGDYSLMGFAQNKYVPSTDRMAGDSFRSRFGKLMLNVTEFPTLQLMKDLSQLRHSPRLAERARNPK